MSSIEILVNTFLFTDKINKFTFQINLLGLYFVCHWLFSFSTKFLKLIFKYKLILYFVLQKY